MVAFDRMPCAGKTGERAGLLTNYLSPAYNYLVELSGINFKACVSCSNQRLKSSTFCSAQAAIVIRGFEVTGFSDEVNFLISAVAETRRIRQMKIVEMIRAIVQATPPSMP